MAQNASHFHDTLAPFALGSPASVTLSTTDKALYSASAGVVPALGNGWYNAYAGKRVRIRLACQCTTAATPGNGTWDIYWGSGADATGTILASSAATALVANQTNRTVILDLVVSVRAVGPTTTSGSMLVTGWVSYDVALVTAATGNNVNIPASAPAAVASLDLTGANIISVQFKRSGSTAETIQIVDHQFDSLNAA